MKTIIAAAALLLATGAPSSAQTADITGTWDLNVNTSQGPMPSTLILKKDGQRILGTIIGQLGEISVEAELKDKAVEIWGTVQTSSGPLEFGLAGTFDGTAMKGTVAYARATQGDWSATRAAGTPASAATPSAVTPSAATPSAATQDKIDVSGTWAFEVTTDMGTGSSTMVFKQDGEKLTGTYSGQYGEAALTGAVKGKDITFAYDLARESMTVHVTYAGIVDKDTMKGTLSIADMGTGSFTAKKK